VAEKNRTKALAPTAVLRSLAALRRRTVTVCYVLVFLFSTLII